VSIGQNGWACLVHGRRLIVWRFGQGQGQQQQQQSLGRAAYSCRELCLPPSDLAHHAKLVNVFANSENQTPSCIAVSPEGN
jgi:nuclear pore complex protein Nup133